MSEKDQPLPNSGDGGKKTKIVRERKPKIKPGPDSFRYGVNTAVPAKKYGPCSFEVTIASRAVIGTAEEAEAIREFCEGFNKYPDLCAINGYSVCDACWTVAVDLATEGKDVDDTFISEMFRQFTPDFDASQVLKREFGAGKAHYSVLNGGTTVEAGELN